ncbi:MAG TPA: hypothetical protein VKQ36_07785, partial [Ktedonobacterales bacterium]|nr:hypothetical protein [Ktedonobacterales bacterium]
MLEYSQLPHQRLLCLDIGGTTTRIAVCAPSETPHPADQAALTPPSVLLSASFPTASAYDAQLAHIADTLRSWQPDGADGLTLAGVGASVGGRVTREGDA